MVFFPLLVVFHLHRLQLSQLPVWALREHLFNKKPEEHFPQNCLFKFVCRKIWTGKLGVLSILKEVDHTLQSPEMSRGQGHSECQGGYFCLTLWHVTSANICTCLQLQSPLGLRYCCLTGRAAGLLKKQIKWKSSCKFGKGSKIDTD